MRGNPGSNGAETGGFTVLEVLVAMFIMGCVSAALLSALASADRIHGRAVTVMNSMIIAENEIEGVRKKAAFNEAVQDCTYITTGAGREFEVNRHVLIKTEDIFEQKEDNSLLKIEVSVKDLSRPSAPPLTLRFLQGYSW